jgi:hypothetical protein
MAIMIYALYTYHWRAASIRRGGRGPYDDRLGPVCLFGFFLLPHLSGKKTDSLVYLDRPLHSFIGYVAPATSS